MSTIFAPGSNHANNIANQQNLCPLFNCFAHKAYMYAQFDTLIDTLLSIHIIAHIKY